MAGQNGASQLLMNRLLHQVSCWTMATEIYGPQHVVNLVNQTGREAIMGDAYRHTLAQLNLAAVQYTAYDFHEQTRGLHYENVLHLLAQLESSIAAQRYCWESPPLPLAEWTMVVRALERQRQALEARQQALRSGAGRAATSTPLPAPVAERPQSPRGHAALLPDPASRPLPPLPAASTPPPTTATEPAPVPPPASAPPPPLPPRSANDGGNAAAQSLSRAFTKLSTSASNTFRRFAAEATAVTNPAGVGRAKDGVIAKRSSASTAVLLSPLHKAPSRLLPADVLATIAEKAEPVLRLSEQRGVFRVNCMDCLDRTNVVQSMVARRVLVDQLTILGVSIDADNVRPPMVCPAIKATTSNSAYLSMPVGSYEWTALGIAAGAGVCL